MMKDGHISRTSSDARIWEIRRTDPNKVEGICNTIYQSIICGKGNM